MESREKKSLAITLVGHGIALMLVLLSAAFINRPKPNLMEIDIASGGPGGSINEVAPPAPPPPAGPPVAEVPQPPPPPKEIVPEKQETPPPPKPPPEKNEFPTKKTPVKKIIPPKKEKVETPKPPIKTVSPIKPIKTSVKTPSEPKIAVSKKLVVRNNTSSSSTRVSSTSRSSAGESASDIRKRLARGLGTTESSSSSASPGVGEGTGNGAGGNLEGFLAYKAGLQQEIQNAWEQPPSAAAGLTTTIKFILEKNGKFKGIRIDKSSGNVEMDQSALLAVKSVGQYLPWPENFPPEDSKISFDFICKSNQ